MSLCIKACQNCFNQTDKRKKACSIFKDPAYQWRKGMCWGRVTDLERFRQREEAVRKYIDRYGDRKSYKAI